MCLSCRDLEENRRTINGSQKLIINQTKSLVTYIIFLGFLMKPGEQCR